MLQKKDAQESRRRTVVYLKQDVWHKRSAQEDAKSKRTDDTLSFEGVHGMVTEVFYSGFKPPSR